VQKVLTGEEDSVTVALDVEHGGLTSLLFVNCEAGMPVSFKMRVEQYNLVGADAHHDYLPVGESELDAMYLVSGQSVCEVSPPPKPVVPRQPAKARVCTRHPSP
jgi:hypothetical protein